METAKRSETESVLHQWRTRILNGFLAFAAVACAPVVGLTFVAATKKPEQWPAVALFTVLLLLLAVLAVWRSLDLRLRAAGLLLLGYVAAVASLARGGLAGSGRDYLVVLPIVALILVSARAGILLSGLSTLILAVFAVLADRGLLLPWLVNTQNPLRLADWVIEGGTTLVLLAIAMLLLVLFHRFQVQLIDKERRAEAGLIEARALLLEQNRTLEERILQRTAELARATHEAQRQTLYAQALIEHSPVAILTAGPAGHVLTWNPAAERLFGYTAAEACGRHVDELLADDPAARPVQVEGAALGRQGTSPAPVHAITRRTRRDGTLVDVEVWAVPVAVEGDEVRVLALYHDLSEIKRAEEALQEAKEAAEAATQAKSAFMATMSHEIRTPMNAVIGMTGLLLDTPLAAEQREYAETIRSSGDALLAIINDILDFSKIEAGRMELERQPFDLNECVESAADLLAARAAEKGLELACLVEPDVPPALVGDVTRLRQVLVNLIGNAVKFTEAGEVVVSVQSTVSGERPAANGQRLAVQAEATQHYSPVAVHFSVRDTGIGIPAERMGALFQSFTQVDASTTRRYGGTGLGLAISRRLVELMGGRMWIESPVLPASPLGGPGSAFHFTVPAAVAPAPTARAWPQGIDPRLEGKRALIVDDNPTGRRILSSHTRAWGMLPRETGAPAEALEWLRRGDPFDVAFVDRQMPDLDGAALAREMRRLRGASALPVVMLSSPGRREPQAEEGVGSAVLLKPLKASHLFNVLAGLFGSGAEGAPASGAARRPPLDADMARRHPLRILLAEDNLVNQKLALRLLERMGYRADVAANGLEVLQSLRRQPYDVILMDLLMPEMDGLEASRAIQSEWPAQRRPRIVAMTASAMAEDRQRCLAAGMEEFVAKPIQVDELVAALSRSRPLAG